MSKGDKKSKAKPLTGLAAALVKSGHLDESKARELAREQRREEKVLGREGVEQREAERKAALEAQRDAEADAARQRERARVEREARERARRVVHDNTHPGGEGGSRRWFFVARGGRVLFLEVTDEVGRLLADGKAGIVEGCQPEAPGAHVVVAGEKHLTTLVGIDRDLVRFWNRDHA
ncbi:MAG: DUF2058 family protein [Planctomycetes bacterium]|nr:DUF2058 family protein [Planctomycetota bacterium]